MQENPIEGLMNTTMNSIKDMVDVNTIIGKPIETKNGIIIPLSKVTFGFASGGSDFNSETIDNYYKKEKCDIMRCIFHISGWQTNRNRRIPFIRYYYMGL